MDLADHLRNAFAFPRLSGGIRGLSKVGLKLSFSKFIPRPRLNLSIDPRVRAAALFITAVTLGIGAYGLTRSEALADFERSRIPSSRSWTYGLGAHGWKRAEKASLIQRAAKTLPSLIDQEGAAWVSEDVNWFAVAQNEVTDLSAAPLELYCRECSEVPKKWASLGIGWKAFDRAIAQAEETALKAGQGTRKKLAPTEFRDPREIRY